MGRPKKREIDYDQLKAFCRLKPSLADCAAFFECNQRTIERIIEKHDRCTFVEFRNKNMVHTRHALIRKAIQMATAGNVAMLIFCLKNLCNWTDKQEPTREEIRDIITKYNHDAPVPLKSMAENADSQ